MDTQFIINKPVTYNIKKRKYISTTRGFAKRLDLNQDTPYSQKPIASILQKYAVIYGVKRFLEVIKYQCS